MNFKTTFGLGNDYTHPTIASHTTIHLFIHRPVFEIISPSTNHSSFRKRFIFSAMIRTDHVRGEGVLVRAAHPAQIAAPRVRVVVKTFVKQMQRLIEEYDSAMQALHAFFGGSK